MAHESGGTLAKDIIEGLNAVNAQLNAEGEEMLVKLIEDIRTSLRAEVNDAAAIVSGGRYPVGGTEVLLKGWVEYESAHPDMAK